jgi:hypothetical protein
MRVPSRALEAGLKFRREKRIREDPEAPLPGW